MILLVQHCSTCKERTVAFFVIRPLHLGKQVCGGEGTVI